MDPCGVYSVCIVYGVLGLDVCGVTAFVAFMGRWRCTFSTCVLFSLCMFLYAQHRWVPPGLAYWGSGLPSELGVQLGGSFGLARGLIAGGRGFASHRGVTLSRGCLCQSLKSLDIPGTNLH